MNQVTQTNQAIDLASIIPSRPSLSRRSVVWIIAAAVVAVLPMLFSSGYGIAVMNQMFIMIVFTVAYNMLLGQGGMLSFGHAVYFGLGGYMSIHFVNAIYENEWAISLPFVPLIGGLTGLVFAIIIGSFSTNRAGTVFAMISLGVGELIAASSLIFSSFSGGEEGVTADRTDPPAFLGFEFAQETEMYYLIGIWMLISVFLMYKFSRTPLGRMANAVRDNPERAQFVGYSTRWIRFLSFVVSGFFAGVAGALFAINYEIVTEETVNGITSGVVLLQAYIGGIGFFFGPIVGAVVFTLLQTLLSNYTEIWALYVGIVFVATVMYAPLGMTGLLMMHVPIAGIGGLGTLIAPYTKVLVPSFVAMLGAIGLLESVHAWSIEEAELHLWGMTLDINSWLPWMGFGILLVGGIMMARRFAPEMADAYNTQLEKAYGGDK